MDINLLKKLIKVVENSEITEFSIQEGDLKVKISKNTNSVQTVVTQPNFDIQSSNPQPVAPAVTPSVADEKPQDAPGEDLYEIRSPIVGTFYRAPSPDADEYVSVGEQITPGNVLCIIEAMKLMNEIESDVNGKIVKILVDDATPVEYNQPLFLVKKD